MNRDDPCLHEKRRCASAARDTAIERRALFVSAASLAVSIGLCSLSGCSQHSEKAPALAALPEARPNPDNDFLIDENINMVTIDDYLGRSDVAYRDMRMVHDPADYAAIGGDSELSLVIKGFRVVPYPYIGTLQELPVAGAYDGERLFDVVWSGVEVASATPRYGESSLILEELFPRDRAIFLMCGGAGYAFMMRQLLVFLGWNPELLYNIGGAWDYTGYHSVELASTENGNTTYHLWRADIANLDFDYLTKLEQ